MEQRRFASLSVPVIGMGTSKMFDVPTVDDDRQRITDTALDAGATFVDSSPMYGNAERILGATIACRRREAIVAMKVWTFDDEEAERQIDASLGFSLRNLEQRARRTVPAGARVVRGSTQLRVEIPQRIFGGHVEVSLRNFDEPARRTGLLARVSSVVRRSRVSKFLSEFQVHNLREWRTSLDQLEARRERDQLDIVAATHWQTSAYGELEEVMRTGRVGAIQVPYNPHEREVEKRIFPLAQELGIGVILMRPFAAGGLVGRSPSAADLSPLAEFGVTTWPQALLKYGLGHPATAVSIPATTRPERMAENAAAGDGPWFGPVEKTLVERLAA